MDPRSTQTLWNQLDNSTLVRFLLLFACGWAAIETLTYFKGVVVIFTASMILAFLLSYPVRGLTRWLPRSLATVIVFLLGMTLVGGMVITVGAIALSQGQQLIDSLTDFFETLVPVLEHLENRLGAWNVELDLSSLSDQLQTRILAATGLALNLLQGLLANIVQFIFIAVIAFFMLLDGARLWQVALKLIPPKRRQMVTQSVQRNLLGFFWGRFLLSLFFTASAFVVFLLLRVPFALILAVVAGLFDLIPGIGATLGIGLISLFLLSQSVWLAIKVLVVCVLLQQVEENVLLPRIMQESLNINPVIMFFALLVGARVAGLLGVFLAIPITAVIIDLLAIEKMEEAVLEPVHSAQNNE